MYICQFVKFMILSMSPMHIRNLSRPDIDQHTSTFWKAIGTFDWTKPPQPTISCAVDVVIGATVTIMKKRIIVLLALN